MKLQHALLALCLCLPAGAQAHHGRGVGVAHAHYTGLTLRPSQAVVTGHDARPARWCGWWMRKNVGRDPGPRFNLARSWASYGSAASGPAPGVIGVLPHHVFKVIEVLGRGLVLAISGNDGHAVRTRPRSTAGVIAWRQG